MLREGAQAEAERFAAWRQHLDTRVATIPGWLNVEAALLTAHLSQSQHEAGMTGHVLEIGVFKGKYLSVLYKGSAPREVVVGVDLFIGADDPLRVIDEVRGYISSACGTADRLKVIVADSLKLTPGSLRQQSGCERFRFISIDGGHTREVVAHDLELAAALLQAGGIIALDDAFNHTTPGVIEGITEYFFRSKPKLAPFAHCYNKLFVTGPEHHQRYLRQTMEFVELATWLPTHERTLHCRRENQAVGFTPTMFGYEIVPFL